MKIEKKLKKRHSAIVFLPRELKESLSSEAIKGVMDEMSLINPITNTEFEIFKMLDEKNFQFYFTSSLDCSVIHFVAAVLGLFKKIKKTDLESVLHNENNMNLLEFHEKVKNFEFTIEFYYTSMTEPTILVSPYLISLNKGEIIKPLNVYEIEVSEKNLRKSKLVIPNERIYETEAFWDNDNDIVSKMMLFCNATENKLEIQNQILARLKKNYGFITDTEMIEIIKGVNK